MNDTVKRWGWPLLKAALALVVLGGLGWNFARDLSRPELANLQLRFDWLALSAGLYLVAIATSAAYWHLLLRTFGERPSLFTSSAAYFLGHLGKYVPGKAWALFLRAGLAQQGGVRFGVAVITSFYEVLTTMAAGALVSALVFTFEPPTVPEMEWHPLWTGLFLLALCGVPLMPGVFNFMVRRSAAKFANVEALKLPPLRLGTLLLGLALTGCGWGVMGLSVWASLQAGLPEPPELTWTLWLHCCGSIGLAYVAGFLAVFLPGGLGVREYFLTRLLAIPGQEVFVLPVVLAVRVAWTAAEVAIAAVLLAGLALRRRRITPLSPGTPGERGEGTMSDER